MKFRAFLPLFLFAITLFTLFSLNNLSAQAADKRTETASELSKMPAYDPNRINSGRNIVPLIKTPDDNCALLPSKGSLGATIVSYQTHMSSTEKSEDTMPGSSNLLNRVSCVVELSTSCGAGAGVVTPHSKHIENNSQAMLVCEALRSAFLAGKSVYIYYDNGHDKVNFGKDSFYVFAVIITNEY